MNKRPLYVMLRHGGHQLFVVLLLLIVFAITASWGVYYWVQTRTFIQTEFMLNTLTSVHVAQLKQWRQAVLTDAAALAQDNLLTTAVMALRTGHPTARAQLHQWLTVQAAQRGYSTVVVFDPQWQPLLAAPADMTTVSAAQQTRWQQLLLPQRPVLVSCATDTVWPCLESLIPVTADAQPTGERIAVVRIQHDLTRTLYPLLQQWSAPLLDGTTLLMSQENDNPRLLNQPVRPHLTAVTAPGMITRGYSMAGRAELNATLFMLTLTDLWGREALAVAQQVPQSDWLVVTTAPTATLLTTVYYVRWLLLVLVGLTIASVALITVWYLWRQRGQNYLHRYTQERQRRVNIEMLCSRDPHMQQFYAALLNTSLDGFWSCDMHGRFLEVNAAYCAMSGYSREELLQLHITDLDACETAHETAAHMAHLIAVGSHRFESQHRCRDGHLIDVEVSASYNPAGGGQVYAFLHDITERKRSESALAAERAQLRCLFDGLDEIIYVADPNSYALVYVNAACRRLFDPNPVGKPCYQVLYDLSAPCACCTNERIFAENSEHSYVWERQNERNHRWYRCADKVMAWLGGRRLRCTIAADITEYKHHEQRRWQLEKLSALGQLTAGVAHELNNPLMGIINDIQFCLAALPPTHECQEILHAAEHQTRRCIAIVQSLLTFSRPTHSAVLPTFQLTKPLAIVERVLRLLDYRFKQEGITLHCTVAPEVTVWRLQPERFEQVLINLFTNAIDALAACPEKHIEVTLTQTAAQARLEVRDSGCGITPANQERVCEPFFTTKPTGQGTGLGLATSWSIIAEHSGTLDFHSHPGAGTVVIVTLPNYFETPAV